MPIRPYKSFPFNLISHLTKLKLLETLKSGIQTKLKQPSEGV